MGSLEANEAAGRREPPALLSISTLTLCAFALTTAEFVVAGILPEVAADLSVSVSSAGHLVTAYALGMAIGGPVLTLVTVQLPRKPLAVALLAVFVAGNLAAASAPVYGALLAVRASTASGSVVSELGVLKRRDLQLALATTAVGNAGVLMVFTYLAPLLTDVSGFATQAMPVLLLLYAVGATLGNLAGGWLSDRALMPSLIGLLGALAGALALFWFVSP